MLRLGFLSTTFLNCNKTYHVDVHIVIIKYEQVLPFTKYYAIPGLSKSLNSERLSTVYPPNF